MKQDTYCLISPIGETDPLFPALYGVKQVLSRNEIPHSLPSLGWHLTHITPFLATMTEIQWLALGLEIGKALSPEEHREQLLTSTTFDFYENKEEDALILRLETDEKFQAIISRVRALVERMSDMKYKPQNFEVNFHVTIAQGKHLRKNVENCEKMQNLLTKIKTGLTTRLHFPSIYCKGGLYWVPIVT